MLLYVLHCLEHLLLALLIYPTYACLCLLILEFYFDITKRGRKTLNLQYVAFHELIMHMLEPELHVEHKLDFSSLIFNLGQLIEGESFLLLLKKNKKYHCFIEGELFFH